MPTRHTGNAAGHSALVEQSCRLPAIPQADCTWQVGPPPWQHTIPPVQSIDDAHTGVLPLGQVEPALHVFEPLPPSVAVEQQVSPDAQSAGAAQTCDVPEGHAVWHVFGLPAAPRQHTWPAMQSPVPMQEGGVRQVP